MIKLGFKVPMGTLGLHVGIEGVKNGQKRAQKTKTSKICPETRNIGEILSRFFLVQALGTYIMTI